MTQRLNIPLDQKTSEDSFYWSELAELTHERQVRIFGWCSCEDNEGSDNPYEDCPQHYGSCPRCNAWDDDLSYRNGVCENCYQNDLQGEEN